MSKAKKLLLATDWKIIDIAASCGFQDVSNFNRTFRARTGLTPTAYRRAFDVPAPHRG